MSDLTFGFIGLGLIGGSIAKSIKKNLPFSHIMAYEPDLASLEQAVKDHIVDTVCQSISNDFSTCNYIFLCSPVSSNNQNLSLLKDVISSDCIITDVGSVKSSIHETVIALSLANQFIGGHPMAGSEHSGYAHSDSTLLENAYYILTPGMEATDSRVSEFCALIHSLGSLPIVLDYRKHDYIVAGISHLPHVIAFCLVNLIKQKDDPDGLMKKIAAGGFKDITRIASSSPVMWQQILNSNQYEIVSFIDSFISQLHFVRDEIKLHDSAFLHQYIESARDYRDSFESADFGPIESSYSISIRIPDETGIIAKISTLFAKESISIKNIGIVHNRESGDGALRIEFYDRASLDHAKQLLLSKHYSLA